MRGQGVRLYVDMVSKIIGANQDGFRLMLPSCFRVPLSLEREVSLTTHVDGAAEQAARAIGQRTSGATRTAHGASNNTDGHTAA